MSAAWIPDPLDGAALLDDVETFLGRFIAYPSEHARVAHTLWIVHAHLMDQWESTPRIAFLSPEPGSGKSRCLEVTEPLVPRPVHAVNTTPAYLFRKVSDEAGPPTILYDEIDTVFGPRAKDNEDVRGMLNAGHRRGATAGRCVVKGKIIETEELPAYCAVALAGLNDLPDTIMTRSVVVRMRRRAPGEKVEPWRLRINAPEAVELRYSIEAWAAEGASRVTWPEMPSSIEDRNADVWEPLLAVADLAGDVWSQRARVAAVALVADSMAGQPSIGVLLLRDLQTVFAGRDRMPTEAILTGLHQLDESPWADMRGKPVDSRWLSRQLSKYDVKPKVIRTEDGTPRGYDAADLADPWTRYVAPAEDPFRKLGHTTKTPATPVLSPSRQESATSATSRDRRRPVRRCFRGCGAHGSTGSGQWGSRCLSRLSHGAHRQSRNRQRWAVPRLRPTPGCCPVRPPAADRGAPRILQLSLGEGDEWHVLLAFTTYREACRRGHLVCPPALDRVIAQLSRRILSGQVGPTFDASPPGAEYRSVEKLLVTYPDAARMLSLSVSTLKRRVRGGLLAPVHVGRSVRLRVADIEALIDSGEPTC